MRRGHCAPFYGGQLDLHLTQSCLGRGFPPYQIASWSIQPFDNNTPTLHTNRQERQAGQQSHSIGWTITWKGRPKINVNVIFHPYERKFKCIYTLFSIHRDGNLSVTIPYFPSAKICLLLSVFADKRPIPFFYTYPHKKPSFKWINDQFIVAGIR